MNRTQIGERKSRRIVVVTGGAGFIGSHTVEALLADPKIQVRVLDNLSSGQRSNLPNSRRVTLKIGDVRDLKAVDDALSGADCCLHLAAQVSVVQSVREPGDSASHNVLGFVNVLDAATRLGIRRVVYASSAAVYGQPPRLPLDESAPTVPISPYGLEKLIDEQYASLFSRMHGLQTLGLRYFNVFGPRQKPDSPYSGVIARFLDAFARGVQPKIFGDGRQTRDFIHVRDVASANAKALASDVCGVFNVATGVPCDLLALVDHLRQISGKDLAPIFQPEREGDIRASLGTASALRDQLGVTPRWSLSMGLSEIIRDGEGIAA